MTDNNAVVASYKFNAAVRIAVKELNHAGFDMKKLSIVGRDHLPKEQPLGCYSVGNRMKYCGSAEAFWGKMWETLSGSAFFLIPNIGPVLVAGPLVAWIVGALKGSVALEGVSAIGAGLCCMGIPKRNVQRYEADLQAGDLMVIAHGTSLQACRVREVIKRTTADTLEEHQLSSAGTGQGLAGAH